MYRIIMGAVLLLLSVAGGGTAMAGTCADGFTLPPTAQSTFHANGTLEIQVGAPWMVVQLDGGAGLSLTQHCDCLSGTSGCNPVVYKDRSGCEQGSCSTCNGRRKGVVLDVYGVRVVGDTETDRFDLLDAERALDVPFVGQEVDLFVDQLRHGLVPPPESAGADAPDGWTHLLVSAYGHHMQILVPDDGAFGPDVTSADRDCKCSDGPGCNYKNIGMGAWTCVRDGCTGTCTASDVAYQVLASEL